MPMRAHCMILRYFFLIISTSNLKCRYVNEITIYESTAGCLMKTTLASCDCCSYIALPSCGSCCHALPAAAPTSAARRIPGWPAYNGWQTILDGVLHSTLSFKPGLHHKLFLLFSGPSSTPSHCMQQLAWAKLADSFRVFEAQSSP